MDDVYIGKGKLAGKGVFAARDFEVGEVVKYYDLIPLSEGDFVALPKSEHMFVHSFWGKMYLFPEPSRYTNHSPNPNTRSDLERMCDIAVKPIKKGEMITINATNEIKNELKTFIEVYEEGKTINNFDWLKGGYRNAVVSYKADDIKKRIDLKRVNGNWKILNEVLGQ
ncbi:MAG: hypothetical protein COV59_05320 [Candidatus Magasanikbacteria bacterium CG11_big_fil_rev_8_21_14_0_20_39_34]|uniref:SET domain-containing protein n=1 Tax=Candidatus Magasanikbacteria bacterium CG11_big_fil_rev_8_21_14_0_20_39_34 TaxID=1974653 RepID=A0A2H0N3W3_9BACT|nr:MAG: hypothetical protein COV59_05320 [Candidatus Magasanikbacteria bacterium CG11_big_fil_rev_8_21_14_0_20_39_34]